MIWFPPAPDIPLRFICNFLGTNWSDLSGFYITVPPVHDLFLSNILAAEGFYPTGY